MLRKRKRDFGNHAADILRNSMVTGIPQIVGTTYTSKKVIRALVLIGCLTGFVYQTSDFMNLYWQYKTITDVKVKENKETEMPSITVCNLNGLYRSRICNDSRFMSNCSTFENDKDSAIDWCGCLDGRWCDNGVLEDIQIADSKVYQQIREMEYEDYKMLLQMLDEFINSCEIVHVSDAETVAKCDLEYYQQVHCPSGSHKMAGCYTLNTIIGRPETEPQKILSKGIYNFVLHPHAEEYPPTSQSVSAHLSIHSPRQIVNPFTNGFTMNLNTIQNIRLKKVVKKLLPAPYDTNCVDYMERWKSRGGYGPTNQRECIAECDKNISLKYMSCLSEFYKFPGNEKQCRENMYFTLDETDEYDDEPDDPIIDCEELNCYPACYEESYEATREITDENKPVNCFNKPIPKQGIKIYIHMNGMETTTYTYSPKYETVEAFSYIGGYIGIWLGISLVAVFDFLETVILIMSYPFKSYRKTRARNGRLTKIKTLTRDFCKHV